jgi:D-alanyl-lipoteichoic acid acyltransferase DltB (MBOAT superfamily)
VLFNTLAYAEFFGAVFVVSWLLARFQKLRITFLLFASYFFYANFYEGNERFLVLLILASSTADWLLGNAIARASSASRRKLWLAGTVVLNLGVLAVFKYFDFGIDSARAALSALGLHPPEVALEVALPIGISFFTFESMSYVMDVYRGDIDPHPSYLEYLVFVAFFPHLVAGPIVRPRDLLPQLARAARFDPGEGSEALFLIAVGLVKKVAIGDYLATNLIDRVFDAPLQYSALECYAAVLGYAVQIYCDFSGYTDIAIGSALLLGVRFPKNFNAPYKAENVVDFWRRWHISLSTWLRDYLYVPLGGNRKGRARTYLNLMITMLLGGLWHGANWTFVAWGGLHGGALAVTRFVRHWRGKEDVVRERKTVGDWVFSVVKVVATFHFVLLTWVLFRSESFGHAWTFLGRILTFTSYHPNLDARVVGVLAVGIASHYVPERWYEMARERFAALPAPVQGVALFGAALVVRRMASAEAVPFVYFQF